MRRITLITFATHLISLSCTTSQQAQVEEPAYIEFTVSTELDRTRSEIVDSVSDVDNIGIFAFVGSCDTPFFENQLAQHKLREWRYEPLQEWGAYCVEQTLFYAYSPFTTPENGLSVDVSGGSFNLSYEVPPLSEYHPYLLVAFPIAKEIDDISAVRFVMQHPLCAVSFSSSDYSIQNIQLSGVGLQSSLSLMGDGVVLWGELSVFDREVRSEPNDYLMMIPQHLESTAQLLVTLCDGSTLSFSLEDEVWDKNERVDYIIAADSLYISTQHRELIL